MFNYYNQIESYKQAVVNLTNESGLSVGMAFYVLKDVLNELYLVYLQQRDKVDEYEEKQHEETIEVEVPHILKDNISEKEVLEELENETN